MLDKTSFEPLYQQIKRDIEEKIIAGTIQQGEKLMSESEMVQHYKVGRATVRMALSELVSSGYLRKEKGLGTFCNAVPVRDQQENIDVILNTSDTYFIPFFLSGISRVLNKRGRKLILHDGMDSMDVMAQTVNQILNRGTDGIILQPYTGAGKISKACREAILRCQSMNVPLITIDGKFKSIDTACIMNNDNRGGKMATSHLIQMGHKNILGLFRFRYKDSAFRAAGYAEAVLEAGLTQYTLDADQTTQDDWIAYIKQNHITAIVCYNDLLAVECYHCLNKEGYKIPDDISIVGYDNTELSVAALPKMTTVTHPKDIMGEQAATFLLDWIDGITHPPYQFCYQPELIQRDSVKTHTK